MKDDIVLSVRFRVFDDPSELDPEDEKLLKHASEAAGRAYAPYSRFQVGAALLLDNGEIVTGNNQENAAYPSGICAERVALFSAHAAKPGAVVKKIAVSAVSPDFVIDTPISPCGACRQVIAEYQTLSGSPIEIIMRGEKGRIFKTSGIEELLPLMFNASDLKRKNPAGA